MVVCTSGSQAELSGRYALLFFEGAPKYRKIGVSHSASDALDRQVCVAQEPYRLLYPRGGKMLVRCCAEFTLEKSGNVVLGVAEMLGNGWERQLVGVIWVDISLDGVSGGSAAGWIVAEQRQYAVHLRILEKSVVGSLDLLAERKDHSAVKVTAQRQLAAIRKMPVELHVIVYGWVVETDPLLQKSLALNVVFSLWERF